MNDMFSGERVLRRPYGTPEVLLVAADPALKRGANNHCAYGAVTPAYRKTTVMADRTLRRPYGTPGSVVGPTTPR